MATPARRIEAHILAELPQQLGVDLLDDRPAAGARVRLGAQPRKLCGVICAACWEAAVLALQRHQRA
jgi:hypothetical protein